MELHFHHRDLSPRVEEVPEKFKQHEGGASYGGTVTACDPPRLLSLTWMEENDESEVTFELVEQGEQVLLVLTHRRLADRESMVNVAGGWHTHLAILADELGGAERRPFWSTYMPLETEYEARIAADAEPASDDPSAIP